MIMARSVTKLLKDLEYLSVFKDWERMIGYYSNKDYIKFIIKVKNNTEKEETRKEEVETIKEYIREKFADYECYISYAEGILKFSIKKYH